MMFLMNDAESGCEVMADYITEHELHTDLQSEPYADTIRHSERRYGANINPDNKRDEFTGRIDYIGAYSFDIQVIIILCSLFLSVHSY